VRKNDAVFHKERRSTAMQTCPVQRGKPQSGSKMPLPSIIAIDHTGIHAAYVSPMNEILRDISMPALATMSPKTAASRVICSSFISKTARFCNGPFIGWKLNDAFATIRDYAQPVEYFQDLKCYQSNYRLAQMKKS